MKIRLLNSFACVMIWFGANAQSSFSIEDVFGKIPKNSDFQSVRKYIESSNCFHLQDSSLYSELYSEIIENFSLDKKCYPLKVDSAFLIVNRGIRSPRKKGGKNYEPVKIIRIFMKFYFANGLLADSAYFKLHKRLKATESHVSELKFGVDSLTATYIHENLVNRTGKKNTELELVKSSANENYIYLCYTWDE